MVLMNESQKEKMKQIQTTIEEVKDKSIEEKKKVLNDILSKYNKATSDQQ